MAQKNKPLPVVHQNRNRKWVRIAARDLRMTQWETKGEKGQKAQELLFLKKGYGRCGPSISLYIGRNVHREQS